MRNLNKIIYRYNINQFNFNIKRLFLSAFLILGLLANTNAQESGDFQFGVHAGLNLSSVDLGGDEDASIKPGFNVGGTVDYFFSENFYLESGLSFSLKGTKRNAVTIDLYEYGYDGEIKIPEKKVNMYYLELPVLAACRFNFTDNFIDILAGPYIAFGVGGKAEQDGNDAGDVFGNEGFCNRFDFGLSFGAKANVSKFYVTAGYELGLIDIAKEIEGQEVDDHTSVKNRNIFVGVGYVF